MKKSTSLRKIIALLLALALVFVLAACGNNNANNNSNNNANTDANQEADAEADADADADADANADAEADAEPEAEPNTSAFPADRAISIVSYNQAGGGADTAARIVTANIQPILNQRVDVVNMAGGGGIEALEYILNQPHDGYTLLLGDITFINQYLTSDVPYTLDDWTPVAKVGKSAPVVFVKADSPFQTLDDIINACKEGQEVSIAHGRVNSGPHVTLKTLEKMAGFESNNVPTEGGGEALSFVLGGQVDVGISIPSTISAGVEAGELRAIAVSDTKRWDGFLAEVPTLLELGYDVNMSGGFTVYAPSDTPAEVIQQLHDAFVEAMESEGAIGMAKAAKVTMAPDMTLEDVANEYATVQNTMTNYYEQTGELIR